MTEFDERVEKCQPAVREVLAFLRTVAENAHSSVEPPTFEAGGVGVTYRKEGRRFCRFDPKHDVQHVFVSIPGADRDQLKLAGTVSDRTDGPWVIIEGMRGAVRLVPEILKAHDR